jgi:hypothetical protein
VPARPLECMRLTGQRHMESEILGGSSATLPLPDYRRVARHSESAGSRKGATLPDQGFRLVSKAQLYAIRVVRLPKK